MPKMKKTVLAGGFTPTASTIKELDTVYYARVAAQAKEAYISIVTTADEILAKDSNNALEVAHTLEKVSNCFLWLKKYANNGIIPLKKEVYRDDDGEFYKSEHPNRKGEHIRTEYWKIDKAQTDNYLNDLKYALKYLSNLKSHLK
jgi:hypothetical protein